MSTLSLRKIKHDSSAVDNITLEANGNVGVNGGSVNTVSSGLAINNSTATNYPGLEIQTAGVTRLFLNANNAESYVSATGTNPLAFYTNGNRRMTINASGHVTTPAQPVLFCKGSTHSEGRQTTVQDFVAVTDNAGWWSNSTYRYTVQTAGYYYVHLNTMRDPQVNGNTQVLELRKNGTRVAYAYVQVAADRHPRNGCTAVLNMSVGDYIDVYRSSGTDHYAEEYTQFVIMKMA